MMQATTTHHVYNYGRRLNFIIVLRGSFFSLYYFEAAVSSFLLHLYQVTMIHYKLYLTYNHYIQQVKHGNFIWKREIKDNTNTHTHTKQKEII